MFARGTADDQNSQVYINSSGSCFIPLTKREKKASDYAANQSLILKINVHFYNPIFILYHWLFFFFALQRIQNKSLDCLLEKKKESHIHTV